MRRDRNPSWRRIKSGPFHRIGDSPSSFFNPEHFMGRSAFDDSWLAPKIPANIKKSKDNYQVEMALPGFSKGEISILIEGDLLKVKAQKNEDPNDDFLTKEIHFETVSRNFQLGVNVNRDKIKSVFEDGLLKISLPHNNRGIKPRGKRKIKVN